MAKLLTVKDVADQLAVSRSTVYKMLDGGVFPPAPIRLPNGGPRWPQEAVDEWVEVHRSDRRGEETVTRVRLTSARSFTTRWRRGVEIAPANLMGRTSSSCRSR